MTPKTGRKPMVDEIAFDELIIKYGGITSFAAEIGAGRKAVWAWRNRRHFPTILVQRSINAMALRYKIAAPYPEAIADTRMRSRVLNEAIEAVSDALRDGGTADDVLSTLNELKQVE